MQEEDLPPTPGLLDTIEILYKLFPLAVASNSNRDSVNFLLEKLGLKKYFQTVVTGDAVAEGKPAPDIYLETAKQLGTHPNRCGVLEDSPPGIASAKAAGAECIGITTTHKRDELSGADTIIDRFEELIPLVEKRS
jgi:HAD superfamily hydrolase (TIGR01509 family)